MTPGPARAKQTAMPTPILALLAAALLGGGGEGFPTLPYQAFRLPNGLHVILHEDHTAPVVGVDMVFDVGSKDEQPGRTGFAHLFEHLMFQGTVHLPKGEADRLVEAAGGTANGSTSQDRTRYWEQVPSNALEQVLLVQSERLGFLLPTLDQAKLDNQRDVVKNERRERYEMQPYGLAWEALLRSLWDPSFPYHWLPIGSFADLARATLADVRAFYERWYRPANASLVIAGDVDPARARALVEKWFSDVRDGSRPERARPSPKPLEEEKRVTLEDDVQLPRLYLAWQSPPAYAEGDAELSLLGFVLSDGKSARFVRRMVMEERIAQSVMGGQSGMRLAGLFAVVATPKPGVELGRIEREIDEEIARVAREGPTEQELERARNKVEASAIFALEPVGGFGGRAATLNDYYVGTGDPGFLEKDLARFRKVTPEGIRAAAARWLRRDARVVLAVVPRSRGEGGR